MRRGWECGECCAWWPQAVPTCIDCLTRERDAAFKALRMIRENSEDAMAVHLAAETLGDFGVAFVGTSRAQGEKP